MHKTGAYYVAPFTGAWIEMMDDLAKNTIDAVAPFTGAWIEINSSFASLRVWSVAPFTGAWIEINHNKHYQRYLYCRSLHGSVD